MFSRLFQQCIKRTSRSGQVEGRRYCSAENGFKKRALKKLKIENREKYEEDNKEEKCEEEDKDTETINKGGQSKKHKEDK